MSKEIHDLLVMLPIILVGLGAGTSFLLRQVGRQDKREKICRQIKKIAMARR